MFSTVRTIINNKMRLFTYWDFISYAHITDFLLQKTLVHEMSASEHRLKSRPQNASLKKASDVLKKTDGLKKQSKQISLR